MNEEPLDPLLAHAGDLVADVLGRDPVVPEPERVEPIGKGAAGLALSGGDQTLPELTAVR